MLPRRKFIDIALNLTDCVFFGVDRKGKKIHESDIDLVVQRGLERGVERLIITGTTLEVSRQAVALCRDMNEKLKRKVCWCTVGCHPAHADEFLEDVVRANFAAANKVSSKKKNRAPAGTSAAAAAAAASGAAGGGDPSSTTSSAVPSLNGAHVKKYLGELKELIEKNRDVVCAWGEMGLDFAELTPLVTPTLQATTFQLQLQAALELKIPLLLHSRASDAEFASEFGKFVGLCHEKKHSPLPGIFHSFNGSAELLAALTEWGIFVSINGSAFREKEMALQLAKSVRTNMLCIETDAPWLSPKATDWAWPVASAYLEGHMPSFVNLKEGDFELGKCIANRNEPAMLPLVFAQYCTALEEVKAAKMSEEEKDTLATQLYNNTLQIFFPAEFSKIAEKEQ